MKESFSEFCKRMFSGLKKHDHQLFDDIILGLENQGWKNVGGNETTYREMSKEDMAIKLFRNADNPTVIHIRYSAEPEKEV